METTPTDTETQAFARQLEQLAQKWPDLQIEDRQKSKSQPCKIEAMRFQAWVPVLERVDSKAIPGIKESMNAVVSFRRLVAWAATPKRLGEILMLKGGAR